MTRVSTVSNYSAVLANLMSAQQAQIAAGEKLSSQKNGSNLKDYSRSAELLTAMRSLETRIGGYLEQNRTVTDKLTTQDFAMNQLLDAAQSAKEAISRALADDQGGSLMTELSGAFRNAAEALNTRHGGKYVFAGGKVDTRPFTATDLAQLNPPAATATFFANDKFIAAAKLDDNTTVPVGVLADDVGKAMMDGFQALQAQDQSASFAAPTTLTTAQRTFLEGQLAQWDSIHQGIVTRTAQNGVAQKRVDSIAKDLAAREASVQKMVGGITEANIPEATARMEQSQLAVAAAMQVFVTLRDSTLLKVLQG